MDYEPKLGKRRHFILSVLSEQGSYPDMQFCQGDVIYASSPSLVYTVVPQEEPNEFGFSEIGWTDLGNIRFWGAIAFSIREGLGFYSFYPFDAESIYAEKIDAGLARRVAERRAARKVPQHHELHWQKSSLDEVARIYEALKEADVALLRGVNCYLKAHMLWKHDYFMEEMGICLYIALEAGLSVIRRRLSEEAGRTVSYADVFDMVRATFSYGDALAEYWEDAHDDRNALLHPDNDFSPYVIQPMLADDIYELLDPMLSLYRYILIGDPRPEFDSSGRPLP